MNIKRKEEFIYLMTVLREKNRNHDIKCTINLECIHIHFIFNGEFTILLNSSL